MGADLSDEIAAIELAGTVIDSATILVNSIPSLIDKAKAEAIENGATAEQLAPFSALSATLLEKANALAAAVAANTDSTPDPLDE